MRCFTTTTRPIDNRGDGRDFGCNPPTKGRPPLSAKRRDVLTLLDIVLRCINLLNETESIENKPKFFEPEIPRQITFHCSKGAHLQLLQ